jgi:hypothetical protein
MLTRRICRELRDLDLHPIAEPLEQAEAAVALSEAQTALPDDQTSRA